MQILYCIIFSDEELIKKLPDCEFCIFQFLYIEYFKILENIRPTNPVKTNYLFNKLYQFLMREMTGFLNRHKAIFKKYIRKDPESGENFLIF